MQTFRQIHVESQRSKFMKLQYRVDPIATVPTNVISPWLNIYTISKTCKIIYFMLNLLTDSHILVAGLKLFSMQN